MANFIAPRGFSPSRYLNGANYNGAVNMYYIPSTDTSQYGVGDVVKSAAVADANGIPQVAKAAGTDTVRGVVMGVLAVNPGAVSLVGTNVDLTVQNIPATKGRDYYVLVADDPHIIFEAQDDGAATLTAAASNKNASITVTNPTSPSQNSASTISAASVATTQGLNVKLMGLAQKPNNAFGVNATWLCIFNQHELGGSNTAGV